MSNNGSYDRAIADYTQAIRLNPNIRDVFYNRAYAYTAKHDYDKAIADYAEAIRRAPATPGLILAAVWPTKPRAKRRRPPPI